jgi:hypothetical protein
MFYLLTREPLSDVAGKLELTLKNHKFTVRRLASGWYLHRGIVIADTEVKFR